MLIIIIIIINRIIVMIIIIIIRTIDECLDPALCSAGGFYSNTLQLCSDCIELVTAGLKCNRQICIAGFSSSTEQLASILSAAKKNDTFTDN